LVWHHLTERHVFAAMGSNCQGQSSNCQCQVNSIPVDKVIVKGDPARVESPREDTDSTGTPSRELAVQPTLEIEPGSSRCVQSENFQAEEDPNFAQPVPLTLTIIGTRGLRNKEYVPDSGKSCYCVVRTFKDQHLNTTSSIDNALDPLWKEEVEVNCAPGEALEFSIWEQVVKSDGSTTSDKLGRAVLESKEYASLGFNGELWVQDAGRNIEAYLEVKVKSAGQEYPRAPPKQFTINLEKSVGKLLGADLDVSCGRMGYLTIIMKDGIFAEYNRTATPDKQLRVGDYIMKVNGIQGNSLSMLDCLKRENKFEVTIQRPLLFNIAVSRKDAKTQLGVTLVERPSGNSLLIKEVIKGLVMEWNIMHPEQEVRAGDRIVSVNGKGGEVQELIDASKVGTQLQLAISRPSTTRD